MLLEFQHSKRFVIVLDDDEKMQHPRMVDTAKCVDNSLELESIESDAI